MSCLTPEERAVLEARLAEAEKAYHTLNIGLMARVVVDQNGERVEFAAGNKANLYAYILGLKSQLGLPCGAGIFPNNGPMSFIF